MNQTQSTRAGQSQGTMENRTVNGASQIAQDVITASPAERGRLGKIAGLAIVTILPALFWTALLAIVGPMMGFAFSPVMLLLVGAAIAIFLGLIFSALVLST